MSTPTTGPNCRDLQDSESTGSQPRRPVSGYVTLAVVVHYRWPCIIDVRLSVSHTPVFCQSGQHVIKRFSPSGRHTILVFPAPNIMAILRRWPLTGALNAGAMKKSLYLINDTGYGHSYYRRRIGDHTRAFEWYHFQWSWVIPNPDFKVPILFNDK